MSLPLQLVFPGNAHLFVMQNNLTEGKQYQLSRTKMMKLKRAFTVLTFLQCSKVHNYSLKQKVMLEINFSGILNCDAMEQHTLKM